jgi:hypothetical protein
MGPEGEATGVADVLSPSFHVAPTVSDVAGGVLAPMRFAHSHQQELRTMGAGALVIFMPSGAAAPLPDGGACAPSGVAAAESP